MASATTATATRLGSRRRRGGVSALPLEGGGGRFATAHALIVARTGWTRRRSHAHRQELRPVRRSSWTAKPVGATKRGVLRIDDRDDALVALTASPPSIGTGPTGSHQLPSRSMPLKTPQWPSWNGCAPAGMPATDDGATAMPMPASRVASNLAVRRDPQVDVDRRVALELDDDVALRPGDEGHRAAIASRAPERADLHVADRRVVGLQDGAGHLAGSLAVRVAEGEAGGPDPRVQPGGGCAGAGAPGASLGTVALGEAGGGRWRWFGRRWAGRHEAPAHSRPAWRRG